MNVLYDDDNVFSQIIRGNIPCRKVYEDEHTLAFYDINPAAKVHVLVVPKDRYISFDDFLADAGAEEVHRFFATVRKIAHDLDLKDSGYRLVTNHGKDANQAVPHFHMHILGGENMSGF